MYRYEADRSKSLIVKIFTDPGNNNTLTRSSNHLFRNLSFGSWKQRRKVSKNGQFNFMKSFVHSIIRIHWDIIALTYRGTVWKFIAFRKRNSLPQPPLDLVQLNDRNLDRFSITSPTVIRTAYSINFHAWPVFVLLGRVYFVVTLYPPIAERVISHPWRKMIAYSVAC